MVYWGLEEVFYQWETIGVFEIVLPFLLIFAIVYGILSSTKFLGENQGVYVVVAVVLGFLSLRWRFFLSEFLSELFPRLGVALAVILAILILVGMFIASDERRYWGWGLSAIAVIAAAVIIYQTFDRLGYFTWGWGYTSDLAGLIVLAIVIIGVIIAIAAGSSKRDRNRLSGDIGFLPGVSWLANPTGKPPK